MSRTLVHRAGAAALATLVLAGCFASTRLFKEQRIWDSAWQGRYSAMGTDYVVLAADSEARIYLIGQMVRATKEFDAHRAALYPGWDNVLILGTQDASSLIGANYHVLRTRGQGVVDLAIVQCATSEESKEEGPEELRCAFDSIDALRNAIKAKYLADSALAKKKKDTFEQPVERSKTGLSAIAAATESATFEDADGVHGALRVMQATATGGLKAADLIVGVDGEEAASAGELLLRIAFKEPGAKLKLTLLDQTAKKTREVTVTTVARPAP